MKNTGIDPARPETYPRRILLAVTGLSPQIVTETLYALAVERKPVFVPTEIHVISTAEGAQRVRLELLHRSTGHFKALCREYGLKGIRFDASCIHTIGAADGTPLRDIQTNMENTRAADAITDLVRDLTKDVEQSALHVSIAGGRKTMGFYLGYALSLYGRAQDRLSHVLVNQRFESNKDFFFPPKGSEVIHNENNDPFDTKDAQIILAEIPFVRMRHLSAKLLKDGTSFSEAVKAAQENMGPPGLRIDLLATTVACAGKQVELAPKDLAFYAWIADQAVNSPTQRKVGAKTHSPARFVELYDIVGQNKKSTLSARYAWATKGEKASPAKIELWQKEIEQAVSRINRILGKQLGYLDQQYLINKAKENGHKVYWLDLNPGQINITDVS